MRILCLQPQRGRQAHGRRPGPEVVQAKDHLAGNHREIIQVMRMGVDAAQDVWLRPGDVPLHRQVGGRPGVAEEFAEHAALVRVVRQFGDPHPLGNGKTPGEGIAGGWNGHVYGKASNGRFGQVYKDVQEWRSKLDAQWEE